MPIYLKDTNLIFAPTTCKMFCVTAAGYNCSPTPGTLTPQISLYCQHGRHVTAQTDIPGCWLGHDVLFAPNCYLVGDQKVKHRSNPLGQQDCDLLQNRQPKMSST